MFQVKKFSFSFILAIILLSTSFIWLEGLGDALLELRAKLNGDDQASLVVTDDPFYQEKSREDLIAEIKLLRKEVNRFKKLKNQDLDFLIAEVIGPFYRVNKQLWMINLGEDYGVETGDLAVQGRYIVGKVVEVAQTCALVESTSSPHARFFARLKAFKDKEYLFLGQGRNEAIIEIHSDISKLMVGSDCFLSTTDSLGGGFLLGKVSGLSNRTKKGWRSVYIKVKEFQRKKPLYILKQREKVNESLFYNEDRLVELKREIKEIEMARLRLELLKK